MNARPAGRTEKPAAKFPTYREVLRVLGDCTDETRDTVLGSWAGDRDRWGRQDAAKMADAITRREDVLELRRGSLVAQERVRLRAVRRALEVACE